MGVQHGLERERRGARVLLAAAIELLVLRQSSAAFLEQLRNVPW